MAPPWLTTRASVLGLAQATAGAVAVLCVLFWAWPGLPDPRVDGFKVLPSAVAHAAFALAVVLFRAGRKLAQPGAKAVVAGETVLLLGAAACAAGSIGVTVVEFLGGRSSDAASITWFLGLATVLLGHVVLAIGLVAVPRLRPLAPLSLVVAVTFLLLWLALEEEYEGSGDPPFRLDGVAWALAWGAFHVLAGFLLAGRGPGAAADAAPEARPER